MVKILERTRVLGTSPEIDQGGIRKVLGLYFLEAPRLYKWNLDCQCQVYKYL